MASYSNNFIFKDKGVSFSEIILEGKLGGREAVHRYMQLRSSQAQRLWSSTECEVDVADRARLLNLAFAQANDFLRKVPKSRKG